jgi:polyphenol oxidase
VTEFLQKSGVDSYSIFEEFPQIIAGTSTRHHLFKENSPRDELVRQCCGDADIAVPVQVHSANVKWIQAGGVYSECDGLLTKESGIALTLRTADCVPLFLYAPDIKAVGLIHIGWRGFHKGIVSATASLLKKEGADFSQIVAALGASICGECYEIQHDVAALFPGKSIRRHHKLFLDLPELLHKELMQLGIRKIERSRFCTFHHAERYHSYRRDKTEERMISVMMRTI